MLFSFYRSNVTTHEFFQNGNPAYKCTRNHTENYFIRFNVKRFIKFKNSYVHSSSTKQNEKWRSLFRVIKFKFELHEGDAQKTTTKSTKHYRKEIEHDNSQLFQWNG